MAQPGVKDDTSVTRDELDYRGLPLPRFSEVVRAPRVFTPPRRAGSVRRTMSIDATWPGGPVGHVQYDGRARDIVTHAAGDDPIIQRESSLLVKADARTIVSAVSAPPLAALQNLSGARAGNHLRSTLANLLPEEKTLGTPLYLLLDDLAGATIVAPWAIFAWEDRWPTLSADAAAARRDRMTGVCMGFAAGSSAFGVRGDGQPEQNQEKVAPLARSDDAVGWHSLAEHHEVTFRRARRIDVWREAGTIRIDSAFQDSALVFDGTRVAVHEYTLCAVADAGSLKLLSVDASPAILPFAECRAAPVNLAALIGTPLGDLREIVLERLAKTAGCTHLNDMARALAEVPVLARYLPT
jgi:Protein of unknown function (DUF2889)